MLRPSVKSKITPLLKSVWFFPVFLFFVLVILSSLKISGTSLGVYHTFLFGDTQKDPNLIFGNPRMIRSDEWLVITQATIAQSEADYPRINKNYSEGRDMSVLSDVPYKEWSILFRPQNIAFLFLPLEIAFAFKWWLLLYLLIVSCYFFCLRILGGKKLLSILLSVGFSFSPFIFWWYQTATLATLFWGFFILLLGMKILDRERFPLLKSQLMGDFIHTVLLTYSVTSFLFIMYPPFQIPVGIAVTVFIGGHILNHCFRQKKSWLSIGRRISLLLFSGVLALIIFGLFVLTRYEAFQAASNTIYPGTRSVPSGGYNIFRLADGFLSPLLQSDARAANYFNNQSEASNFIQPTLFLLLPGFLLLWWRRKKPSFDWVLLAMQVLYLFFLLRLYIPFGNRAYKLALLDRVPHQRLLIGLGFIGFLQLCLFLGNYRHSAKSYQHYFLMYSLLCFTAIMWIGGVISDKHPSFIPYSALIPLLAALFTSIILLILLGRRTLAATVILLYSLGAVFYIHPLYRGLAHNTLQPTINMLRSTKTTSYIANADDIIFENFSLMSGKRSLTGVFFYPSVHYWDQFNVVGHEQITNRYAHINMTTSSAIQERFKLLQFDSFVIKFDCSESVKKEVDYITTTQLVSLPCANLVNEIKYPNMTLRLYEIN